MNHWATPLIFPFSESSWRRLGVLLARRPLLFSRGQASTKCRAISAPKLHWHAADSTPGTRIQRRHGASPMQPIRIWTKTELSAFHKLLWSRRISGEGSPSILSILGDCRLSTYHKASTSSPVRSKKLREERSKG